MYLVETWTLDKDHSLGITRMENDEFLEWSKSRCHPSPVYLQTAGEFISDGKTIIFQQIEDVDGDDGTPA